MTDGLWRMSARAHRSGLKVLVIIHNVRYLIFVVLIPYSNLGKERQVYLIWVGTLARFWDRCFLDNVEEFWNVFRRVCHRFRVLE
ncbi:MAG: hypothetical protein FWE95_10165 [Planctomycetaceae bacterium]|nr:hypothetical protein [Planctomycetaceae bacterium]